MQNQQVLELISGIVHSRQVLDITLTLFHKLFTHAMQDTAIRLWVAYNGQVSRAYTTPGSRLSDLKCSALNIGAPAMLKPLSNPLFQYLRLQSAPWTPGTLVTACPSGLD